MSERTRGFIVREEHADVVGRSTTSPVIADDVCVAAYRRDEDEARIPAGRGRGRDPGVAAVDHTEGPDALERKTNVKSIS
jgi:hypothetical protein